MGERLPEVQASMSICFETTCVQVLPCTTSYYYLVPSTTTYYSTTNYDVLLRNTRCHALPRTTTYYHILYKRATTYYHVLLRTTTRNVHYQAQSKPPTEIQCDSKNHETSTPVRSRSELPGHTFHAPATTLQKVVPCHQVLHDKARSQNTAPATKSDEPKSPNPAQQKVTSQNSSILPLLVPRKKTSFTELFRTELFLTHLFIPY